MRTILNVALGLALAFCLIFLVSGEFEKYVDKRVEVALAERLGAVEEGVELDGQSDVDINEVVEKAVDKAVAKVKKEIKAIARTPVKATSAPTPAPSATSKATSVPADTRQYIDVRGPKGAVKLYVGQPKADVLEKLGTPDSFDFGGTYESCSYTVGNSIIPNLKLRFERGKLKSVEKYDI